MAASRTEGGGATGRVTRTATGSPLAPLLAPPLASERQRGTDEHEQAAAHLVEALAHAVQPGAQARGRGGDAQFRQRLDHGEGARHHGELRPEAASRIDKLRQESREEQDALGIGEGGQGLLPEASLSSHIGFP